jgi:hypothetical protein
MRWSKPGSSATRSDIPVPRLSTCVAPAKAAGAVFSEDDLVGDPVIRPAHGRPPEGRAAVSQSS